MTWRIDEASEDRPQTEEEAEKMQADSDRLANRIEARLQREGNGADYGRILEEELELRRIERGEPLPTPEEEERRAAWIEEMNQAAEEALRNPDPELEALLERKHPVAELAHELGFRLWQEAKTRGWASDRSTEEHPMTDLGMSALSASAKLAGALNGREWPPSVHDCAGIIVRLKRARGYLDDALRAVEACREEKLGDPAWCTDAERQLHELAQECDLLTADLRARLARGFD